MPEKELNLGQFALQAGLQPPLGVGMRQKMKPKENLIKSPSTDNLSRIGFTELNLPQSIWFFSYKLQIKSHKITIKIETRALLMLHLGVLRTCYGIYVLATIMFVFSFHPGHANQLFALLPHPSSFLYCFKKHWRPLFLLNFSCTGGQWLVVSFCPEMCWIEHEADFSCYW